jgi:UDP-N-acetylmuramoyl-tripeptide--D-alanyl-D-alanine ligase
MDIAAIYSVYQKANKVCTDTRALEKNDLFFALKGDHFDGNQYAIAALEKGALAAVVDDPELKAIPNCIWVPNVLSTLQAIALYHRRRFTIPFLAITGSNGKTTTKELVQRVMAQKYTAFATKGNLNNHIGIPLTLLSIPESCTFAIIEMGANHQGEIASYCRYTEPDFGLITNIGKAHLEGFGGLSGVRKGKGELYDFLKSQEQLIFLNMRQVALIEMMREKGLVRVQAYGQDQTEDAVKLIAEQPFIQYETLGKQIETNLSGVYNFENIVTAIAVGRYFQVPEEAIHAAIASYAPDNNRSQWMRIGEDTFLLDAYNANPSSMRAAIESFRQYPATQKGLVLGDMLEMGEAATMEHRAIAQLIMEGGFQQVFLCGPLMKTAADLIPNSFWAKDVDELKMVWQEHKLNAAHWLIKGSRGMKLERLLPSQ